MKELIALEFDNPINKRIPRHVRTVLFYSGSEDDIFIPASILGDEQAILLSCTFDGAPVSVHMGHVFCQLSWARREFSGDQDMEKAATVCVKSVRGYLSCEATT